MNSEELELSLRTEFESYLKGVFADIRQDVSEFQKNFEAEFEKHKSQLDEAFRGLSARFESDKPFDLSFTESVVEHLRQARDEGALLTATAIGEAEKLEKESAPAANFDQIRDAIIEISSKNSQSEILQSLVDHAANFTPRGAFFIVKNEQFVGWKVFGKEGNADDASVRSVQFPVSAETLLADAIDSLSTKESAYGGHADDTLYLESLEFGRPDRMYAIPLTARGRGVAVLYADYGTEGVTLNTEALETLVRVAGLTVELLAASQTAVARTGDSQAPSAEPLQEEAQDVEAVEAADPQSQDDYLASGYEADEAVHEEEPAFSEAADFEEPTVVDDVEPESAEEYVGAVTYDEPAQEESFSSSDAVETSSDDAIAASEEPGAAVETESYFETSEEPEAAVETESYFETSQESEAPVPVVAEEVSYFEPAGENEAAEPAYVESASEAAFSSNDAFDVGEVEHAYEETVEPSADFSPHTDEANGNGNMIQPVAEPVVEVASAQPVKSRFSDRHVDLPIEVADDEKRLHNDARRFARLLVSEIKLYNEQKVTDGRETKDLYDRLREPIDRSRDMYDKRVPPQVASKFDYFHYELVNALAEGDDGKLGQNYPGAKT